MAYLIKKSPELIDTALVECNGIKGRVGLLELFQNHGGLAGNTGHSMAAIDEGEEASTGAVDSVYSDCHIVCQVVPLEVTFMARLTVGNFTYDRERCDDKGHFYQRA